jgi:GDPmannose 4,6-dehydratase
MIGSEERDAAYIIGELLMETPNHRKRALITGVGGQDGFYLATLLSSLNYDVFGLIRGQKDSPAKIDLNKIANLRLIHGDLTDLPSLIRALEISTPDEVYNLGAMSFVGMSWSQAELTGDVTGLGALRILEAMRIYCQSDMSKIRFYQASSSEMFGKVAETPQNENTKFHPRSPYGVAKTYAHYMTMNFRESYGLHASSGILFNHESPHRGLEFVTRKITNGVARIHLGLQDKISLGNLEARRDWGFAGDYVEAMWMMLQQPEGDDYVIATGIAHSVRDLLDEAFEVINVSSWEDYVNIDREFFRPAEVDLLLGDPSKALLKLGWKPKKSFKEMISEMVEFDIQRNQPGH